MSKAPGEVYVELPLERRGQSTELVVIMHGYNGSPEVLSDVVEAVRQALPNADLLVPRYRAGLFSNTDAYLLASQLANQVENLCTSQETDGAPYRTVILVGHSAGSLILRKAYVFGRGSTADHPHHGGLSKPQGWVKAVSRIVLLAGMNRGWALSPRPKHMKRWKQGLHAVGLMIGSLTGSARFIRSLRRGAPFVADLRVQWIRLARELGSNVALTVQLLGDVDDVVDEQDSKDTLAAKNFVYVPVDATGHMNISVFSGSVCAEQRRERFLQALTLDSEELVERYSDPTDNLRDLVGQQPDTHEPRIVFLMHGIRDYGSWTKEIEGKIKEMDPTTTVVTSSFGYFPMARFLLLHERQKNVRWFMDQYTEALAAQPNARVSFFGHSNGTYLLASALKRYATMTFDRVAFAGSVVPRAFPWREYIRADGTGRVAVLRNDLGAADVVVGVFPRLFELIHELARGTLSGTSDIGSGGFTGFTDDVADDHQRILKGRHNAGIHEANHRSIALFLVQGVYEYNKDSLADEPAAWASLASRLCWLVWFVLIALTAALGWSLLALGSGFGLAPWVVLIGYAALVLLLLYTV